MKRRIISKALVLTSEDAAILLERLLLRKVWYILVKIQRARLWRLPVLIN